jgi:RsiW-degrading membrane proteinase PrsW (M82 family)
VAAAPSLALLTYFYLRDRYEREPISHIVAAYLLDIFALLAAQGATYEGLETLPGFPSLWRGAIFEVEDGDREAVKGLVG